MNLYVFIIFSISSTFLIYKERIYITFMLNKYKYSIEFLFIVFFILSIPFIVLSNYSTIAYFLLTLWSVILAIAFLKDENLKYFYIGIKYLLYLYILVILFYLYFTFGKYLQGYHLEYMINEKVSANGVTSFLDMLLGVYTSLRIKLKNKSSIIISLLSLYIAIEGYGRGSIIFVLIMIIINLIFIFFHLKKSYKLFFILANISLISLLLPFSYDVYQTTKLASGFESPRFEMLNEYLNKIDVYSLFFGASYDNTIISNEYNNNPHITYIRTHHIFGLFYLFGLVYIIFKKIFYVVTSNNLVNWMILCILLNILIRTISEPLLFPSLFDSFFIIILFLITKPIKKENA